MVSYYISSNNELAMLRRKRKDTPAFDSGTFNPERNMYGVVDSSANS